MTNLPAGLGEFLKTQDAAVLSVVIDAKGTVHNAALLYAHSESPLSFYFVTEKNTEKCKMLVDGSTQKAACVVGTIKNTQFTLQMRGKLKIVNVSAHQADLDLYLKKFPNGPDNINEEANVLLQFIPDWSRYIDYQKGYDRHMLEVD